MKLCCVKIIARCARYSDRCFTWTGEVEYGSSLIDFMNSNDDEDIIKESYDFLRGRMKPYHLLFVNNQMLRIDQYKKYLILSNIEIKVLPFVSGG